MRGQRSKFGSRLIHPQENKQGRKDAENRLKESDETGRVTKKGGREKVENQVILDDNCLFSLLSKLT